MRVRSLRALDPISAVAVLLLLLGAIELVAGALTTGVTTDEPIEAEEARSWLREGWYLPEGLVVAGRPDPHSEFASPFVYGPAYEAVAHAVNAVVGNEGIDEISESRGAYAVRHLVVALLAALAVMAVGATVWAVCRSRRFALWSAAALLAIPQWMGQSFFNPKDIPVASGYTIFTLGLVLALVHPRAGSSRFRWLVGTLVAVGFFIAAGTRLSLIPPLVLTLAGFAAFRIGQHRLGGLAGKMAVDLAVVGGMAAGLGAVAAIYPTAASTPIEALSGTVSSAAGYPWQGYTLTAGRLLTEHPPWWYIPVWVGASMPLALGALSLLGVAVGWSAIVRGLVPRSREPVWGSPGLGLILVFGQLVLAPIGAVVAGTVIYNGMRHVLMVLPALAIFAGVGASWAWRRSGTGQRRSVWRPVTGIVLCAALAVPTAEGLALFPYGYTYLNGIAARAGVNDEWESDYWYASGREALSRVPTGVELLCSRWLVLPWDEDGRPELEPCDDPQLTPFLSERGSGVASEWRGDSGATWVISRKRAGNRPPEYCEQADDVQRWLRGEEVTMAFVLRCDPGEARRDRVR